MAEFASKGVAGSGLGLGIAGTALGLMNGGFGNVLGGFGWGGNACGHNVPVSRYELGQESTIAKLQSDIALRDAKRVSHLLLRKLLFFFWFSIHFLFHNIDF